ncbi:MAG: hypothetical protein WC657_07320 [Candidatus Paceibacterota bacterium]|jgi:hypothetical protein
MEKLHVVFLFVALFVATNVASADTASDWWGANCGDSATSDDYGVRSPVVYASVYTGVGAAERLAQVGETFTFMVRGPLKYAANLSASDSGVELGAKTCLSNNQPYPNCGQGQFEFKQDIKIAGEPRDIVVKTTDGGVLFPGKTGPSKPVCLKIPVYRGTHGYEYSIELDKTEFRWNEAFKITVDGISWLKAKDMGSQIQLARSNAPASSCEFGPNIGREGSICQSDGILTCSLLPDTSKPQYLCAATLLDITGSFRYPNKTSDVTYTVSLRDTADLFDTYKFVNGPKTIRLLQYSSVATTTTNYGNCSAGEGVNPTAPQNGCTRCENIPNQYRTNIATCSGVSADAYRWVEGGPATGFSVNAPACGANVTVGGSCNGGGLNPDGACQRGGKVISCEKVAGQGASSQYHGKVFDTTGKGVGGAIVKAGHPTAYYLGAPCPETVTSNIDGHVGEYAFSVEDSKKVCLTLVSAWVDVKATGYADARTPVGNEFDKKISDTTMIRTGTPPMLPLTIDESSKTMDGNTVKFTIQNAVPGKVEACYQVINHPNVPSLNTPESTACSTWIGAAEWAPGSNEWKFDASKNTLTGTFPANADWNIPGLVVRSSFRIEGTTNVVSATLRVAGGPAPKTAESAPAPAGETGSGFVAAVEEIATGITTAVGEALTALGEFVGGMFSGFMNIF